MGGLEGRKAQELLAYVVLQKRAVQRERLAEQLWPGIEPSHSKKYLRQSLWQLHKALERLEAPGNHLLAVDQEWMSINKGTSIQIDVFEFEQRYSAALQAPAGLLDPQLRRPLEEAVELYRGDLLEGWYCDWVGYYQDLYRSMYLRILDKLMHDAEEAGRWEVGLMYGRKALEIDRANERAHVSMMRLYCIGGDRTSALRQFGSCARALREELEVDPEDATKRLHELIRVDGYNGVTRALLRQPAVTPASNDPGLPAAVSLDPLRNLNHSLHGLLREVSGQIHALEQVQTAGRPQQLPS
ncbi:MAG: AfsR/SARP family transcriptional regulator [Pseudonocardiaceae bacterium]